MSPDVAVLRTDLEKRSQEILDLEAKRAALQATIDTNSSKTSKGITQRQLNKVIKEIRSKKLQHNKAASRLGQLLGQSEPMEIDPRPNSDEETSGSGPPPETTVAASATLSQLKIPAGRLSEGSAPPESLVSEKDFAFRELDKPESLPSPAAADPDSDDEMVLWGDEDNHRFLQPRLSLKGPLKPKPKTKYIEIDADDSEKDVKKPGRKVATPIPADLVGPSQKGPGKGKRKEPVHTNDVSVAGGGGEAKGLKVMTTMSQKGPGKGKRKEPVSGDDSVTREYEPSHHQVQKAERAADSIAKKKQRAGEKEDQRQILEEWLSAMRNHTEKPAIPFLTKDLVRKDSEYMARIAASDPHLAIELLENSWRNYLCVYHVSQDRRPVSEVNNLQGPVKIFGIPFPRNQNTHTQSNIDRVPGHLHCGCDEQVALAGFVMWKTWKVRALIEGQLVVEGLNKPFHPRQVLFFLQFLKSKFGYTVEDMFTASTDDREEIHKEADVMKKVAIFCARRRWELIGEKTTLDYNVNDEVELGQVRGI